MSFEERLINLVKDHEYLYNTKSRSYKNSTKRAVAWDSISQILNRPVEDCKQRWRGLRDRFSRENRNMNSLPSGSGAVVEVDDKWEFYDCLDFLIPSLITRKQIGNCEIETPVVVEENGEIQISSQISSRVIKRQVTEEAFKNCMDGLNTTVAANLNEPAEDVHNGIYATITRIRQDSSTCSDFEHYKRRTATFLKQ